MSRFKLGLLAASSSIISVCAAQAADLPSKKAAPVNYVKICDAYGAGFFNIPGTDTCVKLGGYVRAEYQYVPGKDTINSATGAVQQSKKNQSETGYEVRGRIDVDARTPTGSGVARTFVRLRGANTSGVRNTGIEGWSAYRQSDASSSGITVESALVQWAGFTFGVAPENYAMMPSQFYNANPWAGFPNGMKQIAYTQRFGGGWSATLALEDRKDFGYDSTAISRPETAANVVGNIRLDQAWGFAAIHGLVGNNSVANTDVTGAAATGQKTFSAWALGATANFKLPMIAAGDQLWLTANYTDGALGALLSGGGLSNVNNAANKRLLGGVLRVDSSNIPTGFGGNTPADPSLRDNTTGWNVAAAMTHYWARQWRSNLAAGYVEINPPKTRAGSTTTWGKGQLQVYTASLIYSPVSNLDIGFEVQYANLKNKIQNPAAAFVAAGSPGLNESNFTTKLRVERSF